MDLLKKVRNYTYNQRHCLGQGSFGKVFQAISDDNRKLAIKKVDRKLIATDNYLSASLNNEINIMRKLNHPNIVQLYDLVPTTNSIYLVMELCSGGDLKGYCRNRKLNQEEALNILRQLVAGFREMAKFGIIHRDLKPANILVHEGVFKICDFGFAKLFGDEAKMAQTSVGTPIYMSPQVLRQKNYSQKTDIWSLGVLYYELLFGKLPFTGVNEDDLLKNILKNQLRIPPCSKLSEDFLKGALVIDENARWGWENIFELFYGPGQGKFQGNQQGQWANRVPEPQQNNLFYRKQFTVQGNDPQLPVQKIDRKDYLNVLMKDRNRNDAPKAKPKNMLAVHGQSKNVVDAVEECTQNPRFLYFLLVEFIVNPIQNSLSFDSFLYSLYVETIARYENEIEKQSKNGNPLFRNVLLVQLGEIRAMQKQLKMKKNGDVRKLGNIVYQQALRLPGILPQKLVWLQRYLQKKYSYQPIV